MGINIEHTGTRFGVVVQCSICYRRIYHGEEGIYAWGKKNGSVTGLFFFHSNEEMHKECLEAWKLRQIFWEETGWEVESRSLLELVDDLSSNLGDKPDQPGTKGAN